MLTIKNTATIDDAEAFLEQLGKSGTAGTDVLVCPTNWKLGHCGGMATIVQLIITWARRHEVDGGVLKSYFSEKTGVTPADLVQNLPGLVGVVMARDVQVHGSSESLQKLCYTAARERIDIMASIASTNNEGNFKGRKVELLCADRTTKAAFPPFYVPDLSENGARGLSGTLKPEDDFIELARQIVARTVKSTDKNSVTDAEIKTLGEVLFELFENTHVHARKDEKGVPYRKSVRGVLAAFHTINSKNAQQISGNFLPLQEYFNLRAQSTNPQLNFFELSIFDSGPGLAAKLNRRTILDSSPIQDEYDLTRRCFLTHVTSRTEQGKGKGLSRILKLIKERDGFLRLRTGRLSLYKSFQRNTAHLVDVDLLDAKTKSTTASIYARVAGTIVTILIPVG
jgi:hypothetical protein